MRVGVFDHLDSAHSVKALDGCDVLHGHTYKVEATVEGALDGGMVLDFKELRTRLRTVLTAYDHKDLTQIFEVPSCENLCKAIFRDLRRELPGLVSVRCWEGYNKWAEAGPGDVA